MSLSDCKVDENEEEKTELGIWRTNNFALGKAIQILPQCLQCCQNIPMQFCKFATISIFEVVTFDSFIFSKMPTFFLRISERLCPCLYYFESFFKFAFTLDIKKVNTHCFYGHTLQYEHLYLNSPAQMFVMRAIEKKILIRDFFKMFSHITLQIFYYRHLAYPETSKSVHR